MDSLHALDDDEIMPAKISFGSDPQRGGGQQCCRIMVSSKTTFQDLWAGVLSRMDLDPARFEERHVMMYRDPDGDMITMSSDDELGEALSLARQQKLPLLDLQLVTRPEPPSQRDPEHPSPQQFGGGKVEEVGRQEQAHGQGCDINHTKDDTRHGAVASSHSASAGAQPSLDGQERGGQCRDSSSSSSSSGGGGGGGGKKKKHLEDAATLVGGTDSDAVGGSFLGSQISICGNASPAGVRSTVPEDGAASAASLRFDGGSRGGTSCPSTPGSDSSSNCRQRRSDKKQQQQQQQQQQLASPGQSSSCAMGAAQTILAALCDGGAPHELVDRFQEALAKVAEANREMEAALGEARRFLVARAGADAAAPRP